MCGVVTDGLGSATELESELEDQWTAWTWSKWDRAPILGFVVRPDRGDGKGGLV